MAGNYNSGRRPMSPEEHRLRGTYRRDRHARLPRPTLPYDWTPDPTDLDRLSPKGRAFIAEALRTHEFNFLAGRVLIEAASTLDLVAACRQSIDAEGVMVKGSRGGARVNPMVKECRRHVQWLIEALRALKLDHTPVP